MFAQSAGGAIVVEKSTTLNKSERLTRILDLVGETYTLSVNEVVAALDVSPATVRRDFDVLARQGQVRRIHGGVTANVVSYDMPLRQKRSLNANAKASIAKYCVSLLEPGEAIGLTGGTTVGAIAEEILAWANEHASEANVLAKPLLTVVTNAIDVAYLLSAAPAIRIVVVGGMLNPRSLELTGPLGYEALNKISLDYAFLGVNGFDEQGPGTVDENEGVTNRLMASRAKRLILVMDSSKIGRQSFYSLGDTTVVNSVVVDPSITEEQIEDLTRRGYTIHVSNGQVFPHAHDADHSALVHSTFAHSAVSHSDAPYREGDHDDDS